jgi:hypothetical protein
VHAFAGGVVCLKRAAARLVAMLANHSALSYSNCIVSFNFSTTIPSSSINFQASARNHVIMQAFSKIKHDSVGRHEEQIFQSVLQQTRQTSSGHT